MTPPDWREIWIDRMGLIVALAGEERFRQLRAFKADMASLLSPAQCDQLHQALTARFTPTNGQNGCQSATAAVRAVAESRTPP